MNDVNVGMRYEIHCKWGQPYGRLVFKNDEDRKVFFDFCRTLDTNTPIHNGGYTTAGECLTPYYSKVQNVGDLNPKILEQLLKYCDDNGIEIDEANIMNRYIDTGRL